MSSSFDAEEARDPIALFSDWFRAASESELNDPNAMSLATASAEGRPSVRIVLLKRVDAAGFAFYTNAESRKGLELAANPQAALCFHWKSLRRQVRVEGTVAELPAADADAYFHSRSYKSQIGALASQQSRLLESREAMEARAHSLEERYPGEVPRPGYWRGYVVRPETIEFWQDGPDRLHDRMLFERDNSGWRKTRLYP
jgi:pyridoxamine 5'-phosphate oxidase